MEKSKTQHRWSAEEVDKLQRMLNTGIKPAKIAETLGLEATVIYSKIKELKKKTSEDTTSIPSMKSQKPVDSKLEALAEENAILKRQVDNLHRENLELKKKDHSTDYALRISNLNDTVAEKEQIIREKTKEANEWYRKATTAENLADHLQKSLDAANAEIEDLKAQIPHTAQILQPAAVLEGELIESTGYCISKAEAAALDTILTAILNDLGTDRKLATSQSLYTRIFGTEEPAAGNIILMATAREALSNICEEE